MAGHGDGTGTGTASGLASAPAAPGAAATIPGLQEPGAGTGSPAGSGPPRRGPVPGTGAVAIPGAAPAHATATPSAAAPSEAPAAQPTATPAPADPQPAATPSTRPAQPAATSPAPASQPASTAHSAGRQYVTPGTRGQQAFISLVAPGAIAAQQRFGVPASVTIAQAIEESAWGGSGLAAQYHNLFGIKGSGPAGSVSLPTSEFQGGQWVTIDAPFRAYHNDAESISDHAELLATSGYYTRAMADRAVPDAFANDLTGVYATDPDYGANLVALMKLYNLYQFDSAGAPAQAATPATAATAAPTATGHAAASPAASATGHPAGTPASVPAGAPVLHQGTGNAAVPGVTAPAPAASPAGHPAAARASGTTGAPAERKGTWHASVPGVATPALAPSVPAVTSASARTAGTSAAAGRIPGLVSPGPLAPTTTSARPGRPAPVRGTPARGATTSTGARVAAGGNSRPAAGSSRPAAGRGGASIPGLAVPGTGGRSGPAVTPARPPAARGAGPAAAAAARRGGAEAPGVATSSGIVTTARVTRTAAARPALYRAELPPAVSTALFANAKAPLARGQHLYRDVAACTGTSWKLIAAIDWMQCKADPRYSPVHGEKIGSLNDDGTSYPTKSAALTQCACDLIELAAAVYGIDLTARRRLSVRELASSFAAFRWGALLRRHGVSAMEFPYSVAGLTPDHQKMRWPSIEAPGAPDRPGARFRAPFGAVPVVLSLDYPATVE